MAVGGVTVGRRVESFDDLELPGDYAVSEVEIDGQAYRQVWFLLPIHEGETKFDRPTRGSGVHGVREPIWDLRECDDGSLEVRESILCGARHPEGAYWHGYLDEGHRWREV